MTATAWHMGRREHEHRYTIRRRVGAEEGDVLLNYAHHTALYIGGGRVVQASINERGTATGGDWRMRAKTDRGKRGGRKRE